MAGRWRVECAVHLTWLVRYRSSPNTSVRRNDRRSLTLGTDATSRGAEIMDREHVKGAADKVKGAVKDTAGKVTGDEKMQAEGKMDKAKGAAHNAAGDAKDTARDATR